MKIETKDEEPPGASRMCIVDRGSLVFPEISMGKGIGDSQASRIGSDRILLFNLAIMNKFLSPNAK